MARTRYYEQGDAEACLRSARSILERVRPFFAKLRTFAARLATDVRAEQVVLFGSLARGDQHEGSDIDLLVVMPYEGRVFDAIGEVLSRRRSAVTTILVRSIVSTAKPHSGAP